MLQKHGILMRLGLTPINQADSYIESLLHMHRAR